MPTFPPSISRTLTEQVLSPGTLPSWISEKLISQWNASVGSVKARIFPVIFLLFAIGTLSFTKTVHATAPPLNLDGVGTSTGRCCTDSPQSRLLTTSRGHDVILLLVEWDGQRMAVEDSIGLSFVQRLFFTPQPSLYCAPSCPSISEYYAISNSPLKSDNITVIVSNPSGCCLPISGMVVIAVNGANTMAVFDQNLSVPALVSCPFLGVAYTCQSPGYGACLANVYGTCSASIQTSTFDFVIATTAINDAPGCGGESTLGPPPGFTAIGGGGNFEVDYMITQTPRTAVVFDCNGTDSFAIVLDAISFNGAFGV
jgi:hypothetical protein